MQPEHSLIKANQIYTNVSQNDNDSNGQTLQLKIDQTFHLRSRNYAFDSKFQGQWNWSSYFCIDGVWSFDKQTKTITLTATKFKASLDVPLDNEQEVIGKIFTNRVISTSDFNLQESKEIKAFVVHWSYHEFSSVKQGKLIRK